MIKEWALENVEAIFALHTAYRWPTGVVASRPGEFLAGCGAFKPKISGKGGHAAIPHDTIDPVLAAVVSVISLQNIVSRETDPLDSQDPKFLENSETKKFVLVHGEGFGAWCWYKTVALLEEAGLIPTAIDLLGSEIDRTDTDSISTLADYAKPLIDYLQNLPEEEKVILVGHSCGGAIISYALECCPKKISKAVFVCATMVSDGQKPFDVFAEEVTSEITW